MIILILNSIPDLKVKSYVETQSTKTNETSDNKLTNEGLKENPYLEIAELICVIWFTFEYLLRLYASPDKKKFFFNILNGIDLFSILPYFISLAMQSISPNFTQLNSARRLIALLRILRIVRLFKLARHSSGLQSLGLTLKNSYKELGMLWFFIGIAVIVFSSLLYFAENEVPETQFISIPASFW